MGDSFRHVTMAARSSDLDWGGNTVVKYYRGDTIGVSVRFAIMIRVRVQSGQTEGYEQRSVRESA